MTGSAKQSPPSALNRCHQAKRHRSGGAGARPPLGNVPPKTKGGEAPTGAGAEHRTRWPPYGWACPFSGRERPAHDADRHAFRRFTGAFSFVPGTAFGNGQGRHSRLPLIPRGFPRFHPLHQPVAGRTHVVGPGGVSQGPRRPDWLGRTLRRRIPPRSHAPHENALGPGGTGILDHAKKNKSRTKYLRKI